MIYLVCFADGDRHIWREFSEFGIAIDQASLHRNAGDNAKADTLVAFYAGNAAGMPLTCLDVDYYCDMFDRICDNRERAYALEFFKTIAPIRLKKFVAASRYEAMARKATT